MAPMKLTTQPPLNTLVSAKDVEAVYADTRRMLKQRGSRNMSANDFHQAALERLDTPEETRDMLKSEFANAERIWVNTDVHGDPKALIWAVLAAVEVGADVLIVDGDSIGWIRKLIHEFLDTAEFLAARYDILIILVDGNHEDYEYISTVPVVDGFSIYRNGVVRPPRGAIIDFAGEPVAFLGGATTHSLHLYTPMENWWPQEAVSTDDLLELTSSWEAAGKPDIRLMLTHEITPETPVKDMIPDSKVHHVNDYLLRSQKNVAKAIQTLKPKVRIHGHMHVWHEYTAPDTGDTHNISLALGENEYGSAVLVELQP